MSTFKNAERFSDHIRVILLRYFTLSYEYRYLEEIQDQKTIEAHFRDFIETEHILSGEQNYLLALNELLGPVLELHRLKKAVVRLRVTTGQLNPSSRFEGVTKEIAMECYHFVERIKLLEKAVVAIIEPSDALSFKQSIGKIIREYKSRNDEILRYRNFIVHGEGKNPKNIETLRRSALGALISHPDLWLVYKGEFELVQDEWKASTQQLLTSVDNCLIRLQILNENLLERRALSFLKAQ